MIKQHFRSIIGACAPVALAIAVAGCAIPRADDASAARYASVIASPLRSDADHRTDVERHVAQFLPFTGVTPGMRVLDVSAGGGYTSQLLAVAVGPSGIVWAQSARPGAALSKRLADHPQSNLRIVARPSDDPLPDDVRGIDLVTLILNYHDITYLPLDRTRMNAKIFAALKPGGHYVVVDHAARSGTGISQAKTLHRIDEQVVIDEVRAAGFVLEAEGDFLRNPADPRTVTSSDSKIPTDKFALRFVKRG